MRFRDSFRWQQLLVMLTMATGLVLLAQPAGAVVQPRHQDSLSAKVLAPAGFIATVVPQEISEIKDEVDAALLSELSAFRAEAGPSWRFWVDRRSGGIRECCQMRAWSS